MPCALVYTPAEFLQDPQVVAREFAQTATWAGREVELPVSAFGAHSPLTRARSAVPALGAANHEVDVGELGIAPRRGATGRSGAWSEEGTGFGKGALTGLRVLSLGGFIAGNVVNHLFAHLGAEVVKVESWLRPEAIRRVPYTNGRLATEPSGATTTALFAVHASGSRLMAIDMNRDDGRALFRRLAAEADVVVENFGVGLMSRWGCGFDDLVAANPRLVMLSISGYGRTGPRASYRAYASAISSFVGLHDHLGQPHITHHDYVAAVHGAVGVLAALREVERTGTGVHVDIAQIEAGGALMAPSYLAAMNGVPEGPSAALVSGTYRSSEVDDWVVVEIEDEADVVTLAALLERDDPTADADGRAGLDEALRGWVQAHSAHGATQLLQRAGLAAAVVQHGEHLSRDPQLRERGAIVTLHHPDLGDFESMGPAYRFGATPAQKPVGAGRMGERTSAVLEEWLGLSPGEISQLHADGVVMVP